jgi:hypothetical protein
LLWKQDGLIIAERIVDENQSDNAERWLSGLGVQLFVVQRHE